MLLHNIIGDRKGIAAQRLRWPIALLCLAVLCLTTAVQCPSVFSSNDVGIEHAAKVTADFAVDKQRYDDHLKFLTETPHPFGSSSQKVVGDTLIKRLSADGLTVKIQEFTSATPNQAATSGGPAAFTVDLAGRNIFAFTSDTKNKKCVVLLASHYDTKIVEGASYVGANDSGSSSIGLLEIASFVQKQHDRFAAFPCSFAAVFFDGEEAVLKDWDAGLKSHPAKIQDNTYGSRYLAASLGPCENKSDSTFCLPVSLGGQKLKALILLDMIGSNNLKISVDSHGHPDLVRALRNSATALGWDDHIGQSQSVSDDHIPFYEKKIPVIDLIDFNNLQYWHQPNDLPAHLSRESIEKASRLGLIVAIAAASMPD